MSRRNRRRLRWPRVSRGGSAPRGAARPNPPTGSAPAALRCRDGAARLPRAPWPRMRPTRRHRTRPPGRGRRRVDTVNRAWRPSPIGRTSESRAAGTSRFTPGLPMPNGRRRSSSSARSMPSAVAGRQRVHVLDGNEVGRVEDLVACSTNARAEGVDALVFDLEPRRHAVPAEARQVLGAGGEPRVQVEARDAARRSRARARRRRARSDAGPVVALDEPRGDDPDHAGMPALAGQHQRRIATQSRRARSAAARPRTPSRSPPHWRSALIASSSRAISSAALRSSVSSSSRPASAR